jgi:hypothetical protein
MEGMSIMGQDEESEMDNHSQLNHEAEYDNHSDSDSEEMEKIEAHLGRAKEKLAEQDFQSAERLLVNCLSRTSKSRPSPKTTSTTWTIANTQAFKLLLNTYRGRESWDAAEALLLKQIKDDNSNAKATNPNHHLLLADILFTKGDVVAARNREGRHIRAIRSLGPMGKKEWKSP